jgi:hypothetical protein
MQQRPHMIASPKDDMPAPAAVAPIRARHGIELGPHEMLAAGSAVPASAKDPDLVDKI